MLLLLMFWAYLLGVVLVLGAELNAFLDSPRSEGQEAEESAHQQRWPEADGG
jgi:uncharacterized BrkB/YihY/UPF0761 family membrane protein